MKSFDVSAPVLDFQAKQIVDGEKPLTYGDVLVISLMHTSAEDVKLPMIDKLQRFGIAQKVASSLVDRSRLTLSQQEVELIIRCANQAPLTLYSFGKIVEFLKAGEDVALKVAP